MLCAYIRIGTVCLWVSVCKSEIVATLLESCVITFTPMS